MPLMIKRAHGIDMPVVICDFCGEQIKDAKDGNYQWKMSLRARPRNARIYFTHKRCCHAFEEANRGNFLWGATELECLPIFLGRNLELNWRKAAATVRMISRMA